MKIKRKPISVELVLEIKHVQHKKIPIQYVFVKNYSSKPVGK